MSKRGEKQARGHLLRLSATPTCSFANSKASWPSDVAVCHLSLTLLLVRLAFKKENRLFYTLNAS